MSNIVADTHALFWWMTDLSKLSRSARAAIERALEDENASVYVSYMSVIELFYMKEKAILGSDQFQRLWNTLENPNSAYRTVPIDSAVVRALEYIARDEAREMGDRIIAATEFALDCPLVSKDSELKPANVTIIW